VTAARGALFRIIDRLGVEHVGRIYANGGGNSPIVESDAARLGELLRLRDVTEARTSVLMFTGDQPAVLGGTHCRSVTITAAKEIALHVSHCAAKGAVS